MLNEVARTKARLSSHPKLLFWTSCCPGPQSTRLKVNMEDWRGGSAVRGPAAHVVDQNLVPRTHVGQLTTLPSLPSEFWGYRCLTLHLFYVVALCIVGKRSVN